MFVIDVAILSIILGTVLPILVGIVTTKLESGRLKGVLLLTLAALGGLVSTGVAGEGVFTSQSLIAAGVSYVTALASYYGVYKPRGVADYVQEKVGRTD